MIKAICFDLDGVYFTEKGKKAFHKALVELSNSEDKVTSALYKSPEMSSFVRGQLSETEFWNYLRSYLGITLSDSKLRNLWVKGYEIDERVKHCVQLAKAKGYLTCICSNNNPARVGALEERFRFLGDFNVVVFSYQVGFTKPSKEIFQALIDKANVAPNELVYADDNPERLEGARDLGINAFVFEGFDQFLVKLQELGVVLS